MGTTADKLQAILDSKAAIKTAISNKGGTILDSTPLDDYATAISNLQTADDIVNKTISGTYRNETVTNINQYLFNGCSNLTNVELPALTLIAPYLFAYCTSLTNLSFNELTLIGSNAFYGCSNLTSLSVKSLFGLQIQASAFASCTSLSSITIDYNGVATLSNTNAFQSANAPITIYVPASQISSYQTATNWVTLYGANRVTFAAIS